MKSEKIIGVDLGGTNVRAGRIFDGEIEEIFSYKISSKASERVVLDEVINAIRQVFNSNVSAIGIGVPSVVDPENGVVHDVQNIPSWKRIELAKILEKEFSVPIKINNDANCFVLGEKYFGKGKNLKNIVGLIMGTGFGAGLVLDDKLYMGTNTGAGEFGMIPFRNHNLEYYCSGQFFVNEYGLNGEEVSQLAKQNNEKGIKIFNEFGENVGEALKVIVLSVDPQKIILGGSVSKSLDYFIKGILETFKDFPYQNSIKQLRIEKSEIEHIAIYGAAALHYVEN
jgi:glucokinase